MPVEVRLQSHNGQTNAKKVAFTTNRVTGRLQPADWKQHARKWDHLAGIKFQNLGKRPTDHMLIGLEYPDLHYSYKDIRVDKKTQKKRLNKVPSIAKVYTETIEKYIEKGYVRKVSAKEETVTGKWYLPHFPVIRPAKETSKTRIVFDASGKFQGISLNDTIHQGLKSQQDLFDVLLRFRKYPVALVCDIAEMYLRNKIAPDDRPFHRFLWCAMKTEQVPEEYEFNSIVFGVNSSPFQA
ncbi:Hypothetical predicted protein [Mytilus galloprovincialis]|uniref:Uncharacterized protein n=1 Tax=Mytilus galloprovincialis TaxID=29158 RepID=A0A8B6F5K3_MYTGA|nr:Hypothetical predicted protein [Mytilus galloprovincialis]